MKRLRRIIFNSLTVLSLLLCVMSATFWALAQQARYLYSYHYAVGPDDHLGVRSFVAWTSQRSLVLEVLQFNFKHSDTWLPDLRRDELANGFSYRKLPTVPWMMPSGAVGRFGFAFESISFSSQLGAPLKSGGRSSYPVAATASSVAVPWWLVLFAFAILPLARIKGLLLRRRARNRQARGVCPVCNYDLRATPDRCPECGTMPAKA